MRGLTIVLPLALLCWTGAARGQSEVVFGTGPSQYGMVGVVKCGVTIEDLQPSAAEAEITGEFLRDTLSAALLRSKTVSLTDKGQFPAYPSVYLNVGTLRLHSAGSVVYTVETALLQNVLLWGGQDCRVTTWSTTTYGICPVNMLREKLRTIISEHVDQFTVAWHKENSAAK